ncbi:MAG: endonuclease III [Nitrososphaerales archaeon]
MSGEEVVDSLDHLYPLVKTPLSHTTPFQLLIATILSAQSTDAQINKVTPKLFERFPDARSMSKASIRELERIIKSSGFYHVKSRRIRDVSRKIMDETNGAVPDAMEDLTKLPGVGRKTANIVLSAGFDKIEGIAVDTHVFRVSRRVGMTNAKTPEKVEQDLMKITPKKYWPRLTMLLIFHGRRICKAKKPLCEKCVLSPRCLYFKTLKSTR